MKTTRYWIQSRGQRSIWDTISLQKRSCHHTFSAFGPQENINNCKCSKVYGYETRLGDKTIVIFMGSLKWPAIFSSPHSTNCIFLQWISLTEQLNIGLRACFPQLKQSSWYFCGESNKRDLLSEIFCSSVDPSFLQNPKYFHTADLFLREEIISPPCFSFGCLPACLPATNTVWMFRKLLHMDGRGRFQNEGVAQMR